MSEAADAVAVPTEANGQSRVTELKVSGHLMTLDVGLFCLFQSPPGQGGDDGSGLPGVRVSLPPNANVRPDAVTISTFRQDGWLSTRDDAALVRVASGPAQILVTIYQSPAHRPEAAPRLQVLRLSAEGQQTAPSPHPSRPAGAAVPALAAVNGTAPAPGEADVVAPVQRMGDVGATFGDWVGTRGSRQWIEGFSLAPRSEDVTPSDIEYQAVLGRAGCRRGSRAASSAAAAAWRCRCWASGPIEGQRGEDNTNAATPRPSSTAVRVGPFPAGESARPRAWRRSKAFSVTSDRVRLAQRAAGRGTQAARQAAHRRNLPARSQDGRRSVPLITLPRDHRGLSGRQSQGRGVKYLFVHQNFPGQYLHIVRHLVASKQHDVVFISEPNSQPDPRRADACRMQSHGLPRRRRTSRRGSWMRRCGAPRSWRTRPAALKQLGFEPDIIIGHHGWGELLNIRDVWPEAPLLGYLEFYYRIDGIDVGFDPEFPTNPADHPAHPGEERDQSAGAQSRRTCADADAVAALDLP